MKGGKDKAAGLGNLYGLVDRLQIAHLTDQDDVRVLSKRRPYGFGKGKCVIAHLAVIDEASPVGVEKLNRILYGDDMSIPVLVDIVNHRGKGGGLSASRGTRYNTDA